MKNIVEKSNVSIDEISLAGILEWTKLIGKRVKVLHADIGGEYVLNDVVLKLNDANLSYVVLKPTSHSASQRTKCMPIVDIIDNEYEIVALRS